MAIRMAAMITCVSTAPMVVSSRAAGRSAGVSFFSTTALCWKNTIHGMITAPMLAATR